MIGMIRCFLIPIFKRIDSIFEGFPKQKTFFLKLFVIVKYSYSYY